MANLMLLRYNNYFNRKIKIEKTIEDYSKNQMGSTIQGVTFNPRDGINASQVINWNEKELPDYMLVLNEKNEISSRWFVIDANRERKGQYTLQLQRDVIADNYDVVITSPCIIEKGFTPARNPLIFQQEGLSFNEIKKSEQLLFDKTKTPWVIGYVDGKYPTENATLTGEIKEKIKRMLESFPLLDNIKNDQGEIITGKTIPAYGPINWDVSSLIFEITSLKRNQKGSGDFYSGYYSQVEQQLSDNKQTYFQDIREVSGIVETSKGENWSSGSLHNALTHLNLISNRFYLSTLSPNYINDAIEKYKKTNFNWTQFQRLINNNISHEDQQSINDAIANAGEYISSDGKIYEIKVKNFGLIFREVYIANKEKPLDLTLNKSQSYLVSSNIFDQFTRELAKIGTVDDALREYNTGTPYAQSMYLLRLAQPTIDIEVVEKSTSTHGIQLDVKTGMNALNDAPYKMIAFPYNGNLIVKDNQIKMDPFIADAITQCLVKNLGSTQGGYIYDFQLLPYCPISDWLLMDEQDQMIVNSSLVEGIDYSLIKDDTGQETLGIIFYAIQSKFTLNIDYKVLVERQNAYNFKVERETTKYRLVSPNFANFQNFDPYMNEGVEFINVDCTYKPITPYMKLNINYKGLYGLDFDDDRGLICGGDFSLPIISDAWTQYQINNKNYSNIFERETQHLEIGFQMAKDKKLYSHAMSGIQGTIGAFGNMAAGNIPGAIAGAGSLATLGANAAVENMFMNKEFNENMSMRKDMFEFNLQNIQAKPSGLVKTSAFNYNNKLVPFIEKYEATETERSLFYNKLKYTGMTINAIGQILNYIEPGDSYTYIKGTMLRMDKLKDDSHMAQTIATEIQQGVYIKLGGDN